MLLYGTPIADRLRARQAERIQRAGITPRLAIIQAGDDLASATYITMKQRYGEQIGARVDHLKLSGRPEDLESQIAQLNANPDIHGIIVQLPLPDPSITNRVLATISPEKDIDGLGDRSSFVSATARAVLKLLDEYKIELKDQPVTLVGHGRLVGKPLAKLLETRGAKLTICNRKATDLARATTSATVLISAAGAPGLIMPDMVTAGTTVIDVGTAEDSGAIAGDTDPALQQDPNINITPTKGGVGPVTVAMLFEQLLNAAGI